MSSILKESAEAWEKSQCKKEFPRFREDYTLSKSLRAAYIEGYIKGRDYGQTK